MVRGKVGSLTVIKYFSSLNCPVCRVAIYHIFSGKKHLFFLVSNKHRIAHVIFYSTYNAMGLEVGFHSIVQGMN